MLMDTIAKQTVQSAFYMLATLCAETSHVKVSTFAAAEGQHTSNHVALARLLDTSPDTYHQNLDGGLHTQVSLRSRPLSALQITTLNVKVVSVTCLTESST